MTNIKRDSGWSWLVLFCVVCCQVVLGGICLSGGIFYIEFTNAFGDKPVETSWLCSLPITMWFISSPIGSVLTNRYGCRVCSFVGGILAALGLSLSYFATSLTYLFFSHGFLTGLGLGINYNGCMSALNVYFDKYKTLAAGIASIGHNLGLVIFADLISFLVEHFALKGMFLVLSGLTFNLCACAMVMFPISVEKYAQTDHFRTATVMKTSKRNFINFSRFFCVEVMCLLT
ncbi:monocarboxylate transporter 12-like [Ruditapes philippinarum]|uniref:monocarboxylate transporter 12-like n=1 Tax=Ruditapes philippinarum TaxID=129788 RepID=UPI00295AEEA8|nr:monocarboxylate transporter 12-like [Ruditapes philippinarum]